ncbi:uncharacterized protein LOC110710044 [Chenopodium quinoa]|uniref:uncharacterized protein LOC110710044 n=1 Tax=Chenopodium quinoa TaxID=63459 RepID=UPI000B79333B|nr:uncharacterized protein LOC110710044 [Chenopodium quinoa]
MKTRATIAEFSTTDSFKARAEDSGIMDAVGDMEEGSDESGLGVERESGLGGLGLEGMIGSEDSDEGGFEAEVGVVGNRGAISGDNAGETEERGEYGSTLGSAAIVDSLNVVVLCVVYALQHVM